MAMEECNNRWVLSMSDEELKRLRRKTIKVFSLTEYLKFWRYVEKQQDRILSLRAKEEVLKDLREDIDHELNHHILLNDEETWCEDYYINGKLDYRKLLIGFLEDFLERLKDI